MGENSEISWTHHTFNPWLGCTKVASGCQHCYADILMDQRYGKVKWGPHGTRVLTSPGNWAKPLKWNRVAEHAGVRARVFCASLADVFEDWGTKEIHTHHGHVAVAEHGGTMCMDDVRQRLFALIDATPHLDWLLLTKRPENIQRMWELPVLHPGAIGSYRKNVWIGTSIAVQEDADKNIPALLKCRDLAPVLFLSVEPLLGPVDLEIISDAVSVCDLYPLRGLASCGDAVGPHPKIDWVIVGGESGPNARPMHPDWARSIRDQCVSAGVPFHFKQHGEWLPWDDASLADRGSKPVHNFDDNRSVRVGKHAAGRLLDGRAWDEFPSTMIPKR